MSITRVKTCDCIENISKQITEKYGEFHFTNLGSYLNGESVVGNAELIYKPMPLKFEFRKNNKDGSLSSKWVKSSIGLAYCPFCGVKY